MKARLALLTNNWRLKVFSLVISILLFLFVSVEYSTVVDVEYPIDYVTADDIMITTTDRPTTLTVTLKGPWATLRSFDDVAPVVIDLADQEPGPLPLRRSIETEWIRAPAGMTVVGLQPSELQVTLDRKVEKVVAVEPDFEGRPAFGFDIEELSVTPPQVRVVGPLSEIRTLDFVHTKPVQLTDRTENLSVEAELKRPSALVRYLERSTVNVVVEIKEEQEERNLTLPVKLRNGPPGTAFEPKEVALSLKGPRHLVGRLDPDHLTAVVDVAKEVAAGELLFDKPITLEPALPERTAIVGAVPEVSVTLPGGRRN